jgi:hypothetical protein
LRECKDRRKDPEDSYLEIMEREETRRKKGLPPRLTFLPDWDGGDEQRHDEKDAKKRKRAAKKRRKKFRKRNRNRGKRSTIPATEVPAVTSSLEAENQP